MLVLIGGQKGGSGKSTLAVQLALIAAANKARVLLIDGDPQGTALNWITRRRGLKNLPMPDTEAMRAPDFSSRLPGLVGKYDHTIIDIAGRDSDEMRTALGFVDVVLFPLRPTMNDLETSSAMNMLVGEYRDKKLPLSRAMFVLSQVSPSPTRRTILYEAIAFLEGFAYVGLADSFLCMRSAYERASIEGLAVPELRPKDRHATEEVMSLYEEVLA